jgi:murein DD-endopeptidase MepM/ murein hydrolase activator NlpD
LSMAAAGAGSTLTFSLVSVRAGECVERGTVIGKAGATGLVAAAGLYFEVRQKRGRDRSIVRAGPKPAIELGERRLDTDSRTFVRSFITSSARVCPVAPSAQLR